MAGNSGTSTRSEKADRVMSWNGSMSPFVKEELPVLGNILFAKEVPTMTSEHATLKENHETLKNKYAFLTEKLEFEISEKMRLQKQLRELEEQYLGLKRETILLREENSREKSQRERYEKLLEEMKTKRRERKGTITKMMDEIHELSLTKERAEMELEMWKCRLGELEKMLADVAMDCLALRSLYEDELNGILGVPTTENTGQGGNNKLDGHDNCAVKAADPNENMNILMKKDAGVIEISDSEEDENLPGDGQDGNRSKSLERNQTNGKISPDRYWNSVSSSKSGGGGGGRRRISNPGFPPHSYSSSSSSTDTSSSDSDAGDPNRDFLARSKIDEQQFLKRL